MDSSTECVLVLPSDVPLSPSSNPSLDDSPQSLPQTPVSTQSSPLTAPYDQLSPFAFDTNQQDEEDEEEPSIPPSPLTAVAVFPREEEPGTPSLDSSLPVTPSTSLLGFEVLEQVLSTANSTNCSDELDLQLFNNEGPGIQGGSAVCPTLRFPCHVCGKRFRFQSILSLHARAHTLDRRSAAGQRTKNTNAEQNHMGDTVIQKINQSLLSRSLYPNLRDAPDEHFYPKSTAHVLMDEDTLLTPPLTEEAPVPSPLGPALAEDPSTTVPTPAFRCHECKGKFRTASELARHVRILHNPYKCTMCSFSANQEEHLAAHLQDSHPPKTSISRPVFPSRPVSLPPQTPSPQAPAVPAFRCETCGQRFTQSWFLKGHMRKHKDSLDHKCQVCGRGFKEPWFLKNHMKVHLNKLGLKAGLADLAQEHSKNSAGNKALGALYSNVLLAHCGSEVKMGDHTESEVSKGSSKSSLWNYLRSPSDISGTSCVKRLQEAAQVAEMENVASGDGTGIDGKDQIALWELVSRRLADAQQRLQQQYPSARGTIAGKVEQMRGYVVEHGYKEASGGSWECPECGKLFQNAQQLLAHSQVHTLSEQKFPVMQGSASRDEDTREGCTKKVQSSGGAGGQVEGFHSALVHLSGGESVRRTSSGSSLGLSRERVRGTGIKDCPYCGKSFRSSHHLKVHLRVHTGGGKKPTQTRGEHVKSTPAIGERPYKCPHCDYAGTQSGSLKYHLQRHHRERNLTGNCSTFSSSSLNVSSHVGSLKQRRASSSQGAVLHHEQNGSERERVHTVSHTVPQKLSLALKQRDKERHYNFNILAQERCPTRESAGNARPIKFSKTSRRKPLVTSRMMSGNGLMWSTMQESGPLDLSQRPEISTGAVDPHSEAMSSSDGCANEGQGNQSGEATLNQCMFCSFRTSSPELMQMHLQVNHTSKARRKRGNSSLFEYGSTTQNKAMLHGDPHWKFFDEDDAIINNWNRGRVESLGDLDDMEIENTEEQFQMAPVEVPDKNMENKELRRSCRD